MNKINVKNNFISVLMFSVLLFGILGCGQSEEQTLSDVSGVWRAVSDGAMITINFGGEAKVMSVNGTQFSVTIKSIDQGNHIIAFNVNLEDQQGPWTLRQIFEDDESFTLTLTLGDGTQDDLAFVRNL